MGAERAEQDRHRGEERPEAEKKLQAGFLLLFFLARCGRLLP